MSQNLPQLRDRKPSKSLERNNLSDTSVVGLALAYAAAVIVEVLITGRSNMRKIVGVSVLAALALLVAISQISTSGENAGGLAPRNAFAQELRPSASSGQLSAAGAPSPQAEATAIAVSRDQSEPRDAMRITQTPQRYTLAPTPAM